MTVNAAFIAINPKLLGRALYMTFKKQSVRDLTRNKTPFQRIARQFSSETHSTELKNPISSDPAAKCLTDYLLEPKNIARLFIEPIPQDFLNNTDFFDAAVKTGNRALCARLIRNGQQVKILNENGDNLLVRLIEKGMPEIIGTLMQTHTADTLKALDVIDALTGYTPISMAIKLGDRMAIYEIVSPRANLDNSPTNLANRRRPQ